MFDFCDGSDPLLEEMAQRGVNILVPPVEIMAAGDLVLAEPNGAARRADWNAVLGCDPTREIVHSKGFDSAKFGHSGKVKVTGALSLAGRLLQGIGWPSGHLSTRLGGLGAEAIEISLIAPAFDILSSVDAVLEQLNASGAKPSAAYKSRRLLLVSKVWRAKGLRLRLHSTRKISADTLAAVAQELTGKAGVSVESDKLASMLFKAKEPLIFGVGLRELFRSDDGYWIDATPKKHVPVRSNGDDPDADLDDDGPFAFINEDTPFAEFD